MKQPGRNGGTLNVGNPGPHPNAGRPKMSVLKEKQEWLDRILSKDFDPNAPDVHPLERRLREIAETSSSSATLEYIYNQKFGSPAAKIINEVSNESVFESLGRVLPSHVDEKTARAIVIALYEDLGGSDPGSVIGPE